MQHTRAPVGRTVRQDLMRAGQTPGRPPGSGGARLAQVETSNVLTLFLRLRCAVAQKGDPIGHKFLGAAGPNNRSAGKIKRFNPPPAAWGYSSAGRAHRSQR